MIDLSTKVAGLSLKNPVIVAAITPNGPWNRWPPEKDAPGILMKQWRKYYEAGVGAICTGIILPDEDTTPTRGAVRFWAAKTKGSRKVEGLVSGATVPDGSLTKTSSLEVIRRAKQEFTDVRIIANMPAGDMDTDLSISLALECQQAGADMIELNFGCGMMISNLAQVLRGMENQKDLVSGIAVGLVPEVASGIAKTIREKLSIPVAVKLTPELSFIHLLRAIPMYREAEVDAFTANHCFMTVVPPDIYNGGKTTFPHMENTTWFMTNGPWHRFAAYRNIAILGKYFPDSDVMACGGMVTPEQCVEVMMLGAKAVQLSSGIFLNGISFTGKVIKFLEKYMDEQGYRTVEDFRGLGQKHVVEMEECQEEFKAQIGRLIAFIDREKCVGLSSCKICLDNWCFAAYEEDGQPMVDKQLCSSCNICVIRCPHEARELKWVE
ncbi:hypothetical protein ACFLW1_03000 [Chloroflexota bacterium]